VDAHRRAPREPRLAQRQRRRRRAAPWAGSRRRAGGVQEHRVAAAAAAATAAAVERKRLRAARGCPCGAAGRRGRQQAAGKGGSRGV
jgi:hypothetical protein